MKSIASFTAAFCFFVCALGFLKMLSSKGKLKSSVKYAFSICFIAVILSLLGAFSKADFKIEEKSQQVISETVSQTAARLVFEQALKSAEISFEKIDVLTYKNENGNINISEVIVYSTAPENEIYAAIGNNNEFKVSVISE